MPELCGSRAQAVIGAAQTWLSCAQAATRLPLQPGLQESAAKHSMHHAVKQCARWQMRPYIIIQATEMLTSGRCPMHYSELGSHPGL